MLDLEHGGAFWAYSAYSYLLLSIGTIVLANGILPSLRLYWEQAAALLLSALIPWAASLAFLTEVNPIRPLDPVPFAFILNCIALFWTLARFRFLDIGPVARTRVFAIMSAGVLVLDAIHRIVDCNPAALQILGMSERQIIGQPFSEVWPIGSGLLNIQGKAARKSQEIRSGSGLESRTYDVATWLMTDGAGYLRGLILLFQDSTERKQLEEQLFQAARLSEMGLLAAGVAHELNNPLGSILSYSELLLRTVQDQETKADLDVIYQEAERGRHICKPSAKMGHLRGVENPRV